MSEREIDLYQAEALAGDFDNCLAVTLATVDCFDDGVDLFLFCSVIGIIGL